LAGLHSQHRRDIVIERETEQASDQQPPEANTDIGIANGGFCELKVEANPKKDTGVGGKSALVPRDPAA
jgi:hypothetical protein